MLFRLMTLITFICVYLCINVSECVTISVNNIKIRYVASSDK